jgi:hypothetical protein
MRAHGAEAASEFKWSDTQMWMKLKHARKLSTLHGEERKDSIQLYCQRRIIENYL